MAKCKDVEDLVKVAVRNGWASKPGGKGGRILTCPCGACRTSVSCSPSGFRYAANLAAILRRCPAWPN